MDSMAMPKCIIFVILLLSSCTTPLDRSRMGVNAFFNQSGYGSIEEQHQDIAENLEIQYVRILLAWSDQIQPTPESPIDWSFYDAIINSAPMGTKLLPVITHTPSWFSDSSNWDPEGPRPTWARLWLEPVINRYRDVPGIIGWEVFNEPDLLTVQSDSVLELDKPENYVELLSESSEIIKRDTPNVPIVVAATEAINQSWPTHLNYNQKLVKLGAAELVDVWNIHYYSKNFERVVVPDGIEDFVNSLNMPVWVTESGHDGLVGQLDYVRIVWPFLRERMPSIEYIFHYQYTDNAPSSNFGMRTPNGVSDIYRELSSASPPSQP